MKLIVGLGNPGKEYDNHKHNIGYWVLDRLAKKNRLKWAGEGPQAVEAWGMIEGNECWLAKPLGWMNNSGEAVQALLTEKGIAINDLLVIHDDMDLKLGTMRWVWDAGHGGHNGVRSIVDTLQAQAFVRLRLGIGRPPPHVDPADYVLQPFVGESLERAEGLVQQGAEAIEDFLKQGLLWVQNHYH